MDIQKFKEHVVQLMGYDSGDDKYSALRVAMHGMATARFAKTINFAVTCMAPDEFYAEIGTFSGFTLISAGYNNNRMCYGIDDFSIEDFFAKENIEEAKKNVRNILASNMKSFSGWNVRFIESDFRKVVFEEVSKKKMAVLLIDGKHTEQEVNETLAWADPYLADESIIFFDDATIGGVEKAIHDLIGRGGNLLHFASSCLPINNEVSGFGTAIVYVKRAK